MSRRLLLIPLAMTLVITGIWLSAPAWVSLIIRDQLHRAGYDHINLDIASITWKAVHIRNFHLQQESSLTIDAQNTVVSYNLSGLLRKQLTDITVSNLTIAAGPSPREANGGFLLLSPLALLQQVPIKTASIEAMRLQHINDRQQQDIELGGFAKYRQGTIDLQLLSSKQEARLTLSQSGAFTLLLRQGDKPAFSTHGTINPQNDRLQIEAETDIQLAELNIMASTWGLLPALQATGSMHLKWQASLPQNQTIPTDRLLSLLDLKAEVVANLTLLRPAAKVNLAGDIAIKEERAAWNIRDGSRLMLENSAGKQTGFTFNRVTGTVAWADQRPRLTIYEHASITARKIRLSDLDIPNLTVTLKQDLLVSSFPEPELLKSTEVTFLMPSLKWQKSRLEIPATRLHLNSGMISSLHGRLNIDSLHLASATTRISVRDFHVNFHRTGNAFSGQWQFTPLSLSRINGDFSVNVPSRRGAVHFKMAALDIGAKQQIIRSLLPDNIYPSLHSGIITSSGALKWHENHTTARIKLSVNGLGGTFREMAFDGLSTQEGIMLYNGRTLQVQPMLIQLSSLQAGIPLKNLAARISMLWWPARSKPVISIQNFQADLLGGSVSSPEIPVDLNRKHNLFTLHIEDIDVKKIIELEQPEGLHADGRINGILPLDLIPAGLLLKDGELQAKPPGGVIRYLGTTSVRSMAATNIAIKTSLDLLSNFHYESMRVLANYRPEGELNLKIRLRGFNPSYQSGRPVAFNLNVDDNVLKLLRGLQLADQIEKRVQKKLLKR